MPARIAQAPLASRAKIFPHFGPGDMIDRPPGR